MFHEVRVLVIEKDPIIAELVQDMLRIRGYTWSIARSCEEAAAIIREVRHCFAILDGNMLAWHEATKPSIRHCLTCLRQLRESQGPIRSIVLVEGSADDPDGVAGIMKASARMKDKGVVDFIPKPWAPFSTAIEDTLDRCLTDPCACTQPLIVEPSSPLLHDASGSVGACFAPAPTSPVPFAGGALVIFPDRAELLGIKIMGDSGTGQSLEVLRALDQKLPSGRWRGTSAADIAKRIGADGERVVIGCVKTLRDNIVKRLLKLLNVACPLDGVIVNDGVQGYRFADWITVRHVTEGATPAANKSAVGPDTASRREAILALLDGTPIRVPAMVKALGLSDRTIRRLLDELKADGLVEFVGAPKTGFYRRTQES